MIYIALLRGINVGGHTRVSMSDLRDFAAALGFAGARTLLQSGNLVFRSTARTSAPLERRMEIEAETHLDLQTDFFVRTAEEWKAILADNPFREQAARDPSHLIVMFLKKPAGAKAVAALQSAITGNEIVRASGRQAYIVYPDGIGRSRLTGAVIEKTFGARGTGRNWNTVTKLATVVDQLSTVKAQLSTRSGRAPET
jgi:uncharacterized protein (DUF1697 family)